MSFFDSITSLLPVGKNKSQIEYFFALNIGLSKVSAALWSISGNHLEILGQHTLSYVDTEDLFQKSNIALDKALGVFEADPTKVLFGVPDGWVLDDDLKEPYLKLLRRMVKEYGLEPMAYVSTSHALSHLLQKQEGAPTTAVLVGIDDYIVTTVVQGGKIVGSKAVKRTEAIFEDIGKALLQFHELEVLPSKIMLYSEAEAERLDKYKDTLVSSPWMQRLPFLHFPKLEVLSENAPLAAIVYAGASEINPDTHFSIAKLESHPAHGAVAGGHKSGFVAGDILQTEGEEIVPKSRGTHIHEVDSPGETSAEMMDEAEEEIYETRSLPPSVRSPQSVSGPVSQTHTGGGLLQRVGSVLPLAVFRRGGLLPKLMIPVVLIAVLLGAFVYLFKAAVTIYVEPKVQENSAVVIADPEVTSVDENAKVIPATIEDITETGVAKGSASGQKQIGDPAKGGIVLYNKSDSAKTISQGTILSGPNSLKFSLDTSVTIASQSAVEGGISYGKSSGSVTANEIGPDSNLGAGTELSVAGQSEVTAKVDSALSGGTSKKVTVVTGEDQKKLQAQVIDDLKKKAQDDLQSKMTEGKKMPTDALTVVDSKVSFSKAINDQATEFSANATIHFKGTSYKDEDLKSIVGKLVQTTVPDGFMLNLSDTQTSSAIQKIGKDGKLTFSANFKANLIPKLDTEALKKRMKGKKVTTVVEELKGTQNVVSVEVQLSPTLPAAFAFMPLREKNIRVTVTPK